MSYSIFIGILTVAVLDAINPTAIAMTIVILSSENQKIQKAIAYTLGLFCTSFFAGIVLSLLFQYYGEGLVTFFDFKKNLSPKAIDNFVIDLDPKYFLPLFVSEFIFGIMCIYFAIKNRKKSIVTKVQNFTDNNLFGAFKLGVIVTGFEAFTGLPYIGAITTLHVNQYNWIITILTLIFYNLIFVLPIITLIILYKFFNSQFDVISPIMNRIIESIVQLFKFYILLLLGISASFVGLFGIYVATFTKLP